jgi:signal transduction histidine kinase/DNA-binding response OmpR family regulator/HAMP domain-containing protein
MFSSRLFWKVTFYFVILLIILSLMTGVTLYFLTQIQKSYGQAFVEITTTSNLDRIRELLIDIQGTVDDYFYTGTPEKRASYDTYLKLFDNEMATLQKSYIDSNDNQTLRQIRSSVYDWIANIGDKRILLYSSGLTGEKLSQEIQTLGRRQTTAQYLETARTLINSLYQRRLRSVPVNIENAIELAKKINTFIIAVNVLFAVFALVLGFVLSRSIIKPVEKLRNGTQNIMNGVFQPITLRQRDELGALAKDFNHMSEMLHNNYNRLTAYSELMTALNKHESTENVEQTSLQILCLHMGAAVGALYLLENESNVLRLVSGYALNMTEDKLEFKIGEGIPGQCAAMKQNLEVSDIVATKGFIIDTGLVRVAPANVLAVPILFQENLIGVIVLGAMQPFDKLRLEIIKNSVPQIGVAITNAMNMDSTRKLSIEIVTKNNELNTKNAELGKAYRVKSDFLSNMSHELRTPLNSIIGFTSVLLGPHGEPLTPDQAKAIEKVLKNGKHLLELINDILDFSKIEAGRTPINIDSGEISEIISNVMVTVEPMVTTKGVKLIQEVEPELPILNTDILKVKQILLNLLSNAAKFTDQGTISISAKKHGDMISISVKDDGIGIEPKNLDRVFEEFSQIDSSNARKYKGTGLGLPIAKNYARLLGGNLTVQSEFGKGSTFILILPPAFPQDKLQKPDEELAPSKGTPTSASIAVPSATRPAPEKSVAPSSSILVLCIDDDAEVIDLLRRYLIPEGYSVRGVGSGEEGIRLAQELHPAVITLDIMMPEKDGWQVLRELKNNPATKDIPVIIHSIIENRPLALSLGALEVIAKPSEPKKVLSVVERACRSMNRPIMIVDDNQDFADSLKILLETEGYRAVAMYNAESALKDIEKINPSLLFLDLFMPGMDGFAAVKRLRSLERWRDLPIVIFSGVKITDGQRKSLDNLIQDFIEKDQFSKEIILSTIKKTVYQSHQSKKN